MVNYTILLDGDIHFQKRNGVMACRKDKANNANLMLERQADAIVICGDMTRKGHGGSKYRKWLCGWKYSGEDDECGAFKSDYYDKLLTKYNPNQINMIMGNHDEYVPAPYLYFQKPVLRMIVRHHGSRTYIRDLSNRIRFICCDKAPRGTILTWLINNLRLLQDDQYAILVFHYNLEGPYSNFWDDDGGGSTAGSNTLIDHFFTEIEPYRHHIIAMFVGHYHKSYFKIVRGYNVISASGPGIMEITIYDPIISKPKILSAYNITT